MKELEERILKDGIALNEHVLKVDSFLNHQVDVKLMEEVGKEFANYFKNRNVNKIVTIESSGIAPAMCVARELNVPLVIFKKQLSKTLNDDLYQCRVHSFTKDIDYDLTCSKRFLSENDNILFIDDFLANGEAAIGVKNLLTKANCNLVGIGIVIEKSFQDGRKKLDELGIDVYSLARISKMSKDNIVFLDN